VLYVGSDVGALQLNFDHEIRSLTRSADSA
jgi:hypothetical protein